MSIDTHVRRGHPIVFGLLILFGLVEVAVSAWLTARYGVHRGTPNTAVETTTHFLLFASIWTILNSFLYTTLFYHSANSSILTSVASHFIFLFLTWLFWTAGASAITAELGGGLNCNDSPFVYCQQLNALEAFAWIEWILVTFAIIVVIIRGFSAARRGDGLRGGLIA